MGNRAYTAVLTHSYFNYREVLLLPIEAGSIEEVKRKASSVEDLLDAFLILVECSNKEYKRVKRAFCKKVVNKLTDTNTKDFVLRELIYIERIRKFKNN